MILLRLVSGYIHHKFSSLESTFLHCCMLLVINSGDIIRRLRVTKVKFERVSKVKMIRRKDFHNESNHERVQNQRQGIIDQKWKLKHTVTAETRLLTYPNVWHPSWLWILSEHESNNICCIFAIGRA